MPAPPPTLAPPATAVNDGPAEVMASIYAWITLADLMWLRISV
jgi:hypothetical protein